MQLPGNAWDTWNPPAAPAFPSPVLVLDDGVHDFPHFPGEGRWVWGQFFSRRPPPFLLLPALLVLVPAPGTRGGPRGPLGLPLPLPRGFLLPDFLLDLLQRPLLDGLQEMGMGILRTGDPQGLGGPEKWGFPKVPGLSFPGRLLGCLSVILFQDPQVFSSVSRGAFQASQVFSETCWDFSGICGPFPGISGHFARTC